MILWMSAIAAAQCRQDYPVDALLDDIGQVESGLLSGDSIMAGAAGTRMRTRMVCMVEPIPAIVAARTMRAVGAGLLARQHAEALGWLEAAAAMDASHRYTLEDLPEAHPLFAAWGMVLGRASLREPEGPEGRALSDGEHWLDGLVLTEPVAHPNVPHIYQFRGGEGRPLITEIIVGAGFPEGALVVREGRRSMVDATQVDPKDRSSTTTVDTFRRGDDVIVVKPDAWPPERVALVSGGLTALAGSGLLYVLSTQTEASFLAANTKEDIDRYRGTTNRLAIGSGAAAAVGASALGFGLLFYIVDDDPRPTLDLRF